MNPKVLVLGATGTVGRALVAALVQRGVAVRAATRDPDRARRAGLGSEVETVLFDLERPETFDRALEGVERVFLVARPGDEHSDRWALPLLDAVERHGVRRVVDLSAMGAEARPDFALRRIELRIEASSLGYTHLRPNWFMQVFAGGSLLASIRASRTLRIPAAEAKLSWIDARDIAEVAALELLRPELEERRAFTLTGDEALSHGDVAGLLGAASGQEVRYEAIDEDTARRALAEAGFPPPWIERLVGFYRLIRQGWTAPVSSAVRDLLGRPARTFAAFARENADLWR